MEHTIWKGAMPGIKAIIQHGDIAIFGENQKRNWTEMKHLSIHSCGIQSFGNELLKTDFPEFYKLWKVN